MLTATEAGHRVDFSGVSDPTRPSTTSNPFGCLNVSTVLASSPTLKAAPFEIAAREQVYRSGEKNDASFLIETVINTTAAKNAAVINRVLAASLRKCTKPKLTLFGATFDATKSTVANAVGCDSGTTSLTVALGRPAGTSSSSQPVAAEIDSYVMQQGTRFAVALNFYPLLQGNPQTAALLAGKICAHLR